MTVTRPNEEIQDFTFVEYKEACAAYFQGVNIGYTVVKNYATVNALLVALIGALATAEVKNPVLPSPGDIVRIVPWVAIILSLALALALPHYWAHLKNCRDRCVAIEALYGGRLFTKLKEVEDTGFGAGSGLTALVILILGLWLLFAFRNYVEYLPFLKTLAEYIP